MSFHPPPESRPIPVREAFRGMPDDGTGGRVGPRTKIWQAMRDVGPGGQQPGHFSHQRLHPDRPSPTIQKGGGLGHYHLWHPSEHRVITLAECKRIGSFPDGYEFPGRPGDVWDRIGNSVPPLFMRAVAWRVRTLIGKPPHDRTTPRGPDYPSILEAAWRDHLKPREPDAPTVISTFAGGGGSSLGYSMAGYRELLAVEWDDNAAATLRLNFPHVPVYHGDIARLSVEECLRLAGIGPGELDVFDGSPPCQGFSTAGKRDFGDARNQLFREYVRLLRGLRPRAFVMENVSGMVKGKMKILFAEILRELKASGYRVEARLLNAMYYNVPQSRERMIFVGIREDLGIEPSHPGSSSSPIAVRRALVGIDASRSESYAEAMKLQRYEVGKWAARCKPGESANKYHPRKCFFNATRLHPDRPSPTIPKRGGSSAASLFHHAEVRYLVAEELKRLGAFPDPYRLIGKLSDMYARVGNSIPPLLMRAVAGHVCSLIRPESFA